MTVGRRQRRLVDELRQRGIRDERVLDAMARVRRDHFVDEALGGPAYAADASLPIGGRQTVSQPLIVARMCELLEPDGTGAALEVGTGSGYHAAVLSHLYERVYTVERQLELSTRARSRIRALAIENVHFKVFDGSYGWGEFAPYRGIVVTAAGPEVPTPLIDQLVDQGKLVLPLCVDPDQRERQQLIRVIKQGDKFSKEDHGSCRFVPLVGKFGWSA